MKKPVLLLVCSFCVIIFCNNLFAEQENSLALLEAVRDSDLESFFKLIHKKNLNVNIRDAEGNTAMIWAAKMRLTEVVKPLLDRGANPDLLIPERNVSALGIASFQNNVIMVELLLAAGANPNLQNFRGRTSLITAAGSGNEKIVLLLLEHGADIDAVNDYGATALMYATSGGQAKIVEMLLDMKADHTLKNNNGQTALDIAIDLKKADVEKILKKRNKK